MSWRASAYVKGLKEAPNGQKITCSEKLVMFVLADCYNEDYGRAWPSVPTLADAALTTERNMRRILRSLEGKDLVETVESRGRGHSNSYRFPGYSGEVTAIKTDNLSGLSPGKTGRGGPQNRTLERRKPDPALSPKPAGAEREPRNGRSDAGLYQLELDDMRRVGPIGEAARRLWKKRLSDPRDAASIPDWFRSQTEKLLED